MLTEPERKALEDMRDTITRAIRFVEGFDLVAFVADEKTVYAVAHCMEIMKKVEVYFPPDFEFPEGRDDWEAEIFEYGQNYQLQRDALRPLRLWSLVEEFLPPLRSAIEAELQAGQPRQQRLS
jgi:hypothetical protein